MKFVCRCDCEVEIEAGSVEEASSAAEECVESGGLECEVSDCSCECSEA